MISEADSLKILSGVKRFCKCFTEINWLLQSLYPKEETGMMSADIYVTQGGHKIAHILVLNEMKANLIFLFIMKTHISQISVRTSFLIFAFQMYGCKWFSVFI